MTADLGIPGESIGVSINERFPPRQLVTLDGAATALGAAIEQTFKEHYHRLRNQQR